MAFWAVSVLFVITPGADWAYAINAGLRNRSIFPAVAGLLCGHLAATIIVAAGVGALVAANPMVLTVLTIIGAAYLVWLGITMMISSAGPTASSDRVSSSAFRQLARGFGVSGLNPKVFLLFLALLPQFTNPSGHWPVAMQIIALGLVHTLSCAVVYMAVGLASRRVLASKPSAARIVTRLSGTAMVCIGVFLLVEQLVH
ncbi:LysE family translocator [Arthrobacter sp. RIT-PI-e]|uniref:LysE family translocator n=1 Tax=Arthrobacter sp. RIT-PI-e TaxID=1681197 RepID=UPI001F28D82A|nr:LysE family translocator [Arthrobacter sp. RIT-PI-e]